MPEPSKQERLDLLISLGEINIGSDFIQIFNYPFVPSIAFYQTHFKATEIKDIDLDASPPTMQVGSELIFLTAEKREEIGKFAILHNIKMIARPDLWGGILEPFLDNEFTPARDNELMIWFVSFGLNSETVISLRNEVKSQMIKYNFDTNLWEWVNLGLADVLRAMRVKYSNEDFNDFYARAMNVSLMHEEILEIAEKLKYHLRIYENSHYMDEDEAYNFGTFDTYDAAVVDAQRIVQDFFDDSLNNEVKVEDLLTQYLLFGQDPIILPIGKDIPPFSARSYAEKLYKTICSK